MLVLSYVLAADPHIIFLHSGPPTIYVNSLQLLSLILLHSSPPLSPIVRLILGSWQACHQSGNLPLPHLQHLAWTTHPIPNL